MLLYVGGDRGFLATASIKCKALLESGSRAPLIDTLRAIYMYAGSTLCLYTCMQALR